ncbi:MAG: hypothetical protein K2J67_10955 [Lachnospiraceae bacterium]|nr:hypothetical protein [Lachnospiraceae bacterium]
MLKPSYFTLLSPDPIPIPQGGSVISPRLRDISAIGYDTYQHYLSVLIMDIKTYFAMLGQQETFDLLSDEEKAKWNIFDCLLSIQQTRILLQDILNFFLREDVIYSPGRHGFLVQEQNQEIGVITAENYPVICDLICKRNCIQSRTETTLSKVKSKKALEIIKKLQKGRAEKNRQTKADKNMELGNIISAVAGKSPTLNLINIWDLTVFQLWDCFSRLSHNAIYAIQSMSVAAWGNKDNYFDAAAWFQRIDTDNPIT